MGAGILGLTSAVSLLDDGWRVRVLTAEPPEHTTSAAAAAMWHPGPADNRSLRWAAASYAILTRQAQESESCGVVVRRGLELFRSPEPEPGWASVAGGTVRSAVDGLPAGYTHAFEFSAPLIAMPVYLAWLVERLVADGGTVELHKVGALAELEPSGALLINCAGLHGGALAGDYTVAPVRTQMVRVTNPGLSRFLRHDASPSFRTYVFPHSADCVLGGSWERGSWNLEPDADVTATIRDQCRHLEPALRDADVIEPLVGLAPWRPTARLELQRLPARGGPVIHNYGHGGAGVSLAWGCAQEVVALARATTGR